MTEIAWERWRHIALSVQAAVTVALRFMHFLAVLLAVSGAWRQIAIAARFATDAPLASLGLRQCAIDAQIIARDRRPCFRRLVKQLLHDVEFEQPIPLLTEDRVI